METKRKRTEVVLSLLALVGLAVFSLFAVGGSLEPSAPPGPTMKTLEEIYDAVIGVSPREGYMQYYEVAGGTNETFFTVPTGKEFVLLKLFFGATHSLLSLTVNDSLFIGSIHYPFWADHVEDFPDGCVVVNAGETLKVVNGTSFTYKVTIVGYFHDVE